MADQLKPEDWWRTSIIEMRPNEIRFRGYAIEDLIGRVSFPAMIWLMLRGELPGEAEADLLAAALVAGVDHGPQAPSIAIARMAMTCGLGLNNAMASAVNALGDVHGGAGEQALALFQDVAELIRAGTAPLDAAKIALGSLDDDYAPGFGHRFHKADPRPPRLLELVRAAQAKGVVKGEIMAAAEAIGDALAERRGGRRITMNIDGGTAVIYGELGFAAPLARGLFVLSRSVGILAHAWEQAEQGGRNKGPLPRDLLWTYDGPKPRKLEE